MGLIDDAAPGGRPPRRGAVAAHPAPPPPVAAPTPAPAPAPAKDPAEITVRPAEPDPSAERSS